MVDTKKHGKRALFNTLCDDSLKLRRGQAHAADKGAQLPTLDAGEPNSGRRTQFLARMVNFVEKHQVNVRLAYYPPYHSKYNPVERCWGVLERHWNGALLDTVDAVVGYAQSMTWKQQHPVVRLVTQTYESGVRLSNKAMKTVETRLSRLPNLSSWFIDICWTGTI